MSGVLDPANARVPPGKALLGRAAERAAIDALLEAALLAQSGSLLLAGPAGIGKSALVQYAVDAASGFRVLRIAGVESEMAFAYAGVHQLVLPIRDCIGRLPEPQRLALEAALGTAQQQVLDPFLVGLAVLSLLADAASTDPLLVVVEDAHWLDDESAMALSFVGRRLHAERVALLVTIREAPERRLRFDNVHRLDLAGLPAAEALELLTAAAPAPVHPTVAARIVAATEGNPLALVELPAALTVEQLRGAEPLPDPLPIGARALDAPARMALLLAAAERTGDPALLRRAADATGELS